jgi:prepilin-type N-terminal cleavage/methylation domain-containing protein
MKKRNNKGFTLLELMVAVAILGILAAIAIPSYLGIQKKAARGEAKSNLVALSVALEGYMAENNDFGPTNPPGGYTYYAPGMNLGSLGHPGRLAVIANLGNNNNYEYRIYVRTTNPPVYGTSAIPMRGRVLGDMTAWYRDDGRKGPTGFW